MLHLYKFFSTAALLLLLAACTQPAAHVELKGQESFARSTDSNNVSYRSQSYDAAPAAPSHYQPYKPAPVYTNTKPVSQHTEQSASVSSIGVSDLSPPSKQNEKPVASPVNQWTKKPRGDEEASNAQKAEPVKEKRLATAHIGKPGSFMWPVASHKVVSGFGPKGAGKANDGINIAAREGEPVWASADGEVVYIGELKGYGNTVLVKHPGDKTTGYAHLARASVDKYDRVKQGDIIGYVGASGDAKKPQLFFSMRSGQTPVDPKKYLSTSVAGL